MMKKPLILILTALAVWGCNSESKEVASLDIATDSTLSISDTTEKITKTANIEFRVKDVQKAKEQLAKSLEKLGGKLVDFEMSAYLIESKQLPYSLDSVKEVNVFKKNATLTAKIPTPNVDEFSNQVAEISLFTNRQSLKVEDQTIDYLANKLRSESLEKAAIHLRKVATKKSPNVGEALSIDNEVLEKRIDNMRIDAKTKYSMVTLNFFQDRTVETYITSNTNINNYQPGFFRKLALNLKNGWFIVTDFVLFLSTFWGVILTGLIVYFGIRAIRKPQVAK